MTLKQVTTSTVGTLQYVDFENAIWKQTGPNQYTTTQPFQGTLKGDIAIKGTTKFILKKRLLTASLKLNPKNLYSLEVYSEIFKTSQLLDAPETVRGRLLVYVVKNVPVTKDTYKIELASGGIGPGNPFYSSLLTNIGFTVRFEYETDSKQWVLFVDKGSSLLTA